MARVLQHTINLMAEPRAFFAATVCIRKHTPQRNNGTWTNGARNQHIHKHITHHTHTGGPTAHSHTTMAMDQSALPVISLFGICCHRKRNVRSYIRQRQRHLLFGCRKLALTHHFRRFEISYVSLHLSLSQTERLPSYQAIDTATHNNTRRRMCESQTCGVKCLS